jgi:hypothetical protein
MKIGIRYPVANKEINFIDDEKKLAIDEAVEIFNGSNINKLIKEYNISKSHIDLIFQCSEPVARPLKELSSFSRRLYPVLGEYSSVDGKLFKTIAVIEMSEESNIPDDEGMDIDMSDEELIGAIEALIKFKNYGNDESKEKKERAIHKIKKIISTVI